MPLHPTPSSIQLYAFPNDPLGATVSTDALQSNGTVTAKTDGTALKVTRVVAMALEWVAVNPGGQSGGGRGRFARPVRTQQWVEVGSSDGVTPLQVLAGQSLLIEMQGVAPSSPAGTIVEHLNVRTGVSGDDFTVRLALEVGAVTAALKPAYNATSPMLINFTLATAAIWMLDFVGGPAVNVSFRVDTENTSGFIDARIDGEPITLQQGDPHKELNFNLRVNTPGVLPLGSDYIVYMWMTVTSQAGGGQTLRDLAIPVRIGVNV